VADSAPISPEPAPSDATVRRPGSLLAVIVLIIAFAVVITLVVVVGGRGRDDFRRGNVTELTSALTKAGLVICSSSAPAFAHRSDGSISTQEIKVSQPGDCADQVTVQLDDYKNVSHRDSAARNAEAKSRPRTYGTVYTWRTYTVYLQADDASSDSGITDKIVRALDAVGAN
jgi:hypothetical protein